MVKKTEVVVLEEKQVDLKLVDSAVGKITEIVSKHFEGAMLEVGKYLIDTFYDGDLERVRSKKPVKEESLNKVYSMIQNEESKTPSRSWLYNSIGLVVDTHDMKLFQTYGKLGLSNKVLLLRVKDIKDKKALAKKAVEKNLTVNQMKEEVRRKIKNRNPGLLTLLNKQDYILEHDIRDILKPESLEKLSKENLIAVEEKVKEQRDRFQKNIEREKQLLEQYNIAEELLKVAVKTKKSQVKSKPRISKKK